MEGTSLFAWMAWTWPTAAFFVFILLCLVGMSVWEYLLARRRAAPRHPRPRHHARRPAVHLAAGQRLHLPGLARLLRLAAVGAARHRAGLRLRRVPLGVARVRPAAFIPAER